MVSDCPNPMFTGVAEEWRKDFVEKRGRQMSDRHTLFKKRLTELGMFDEDSDYGGMIGEAVMELSKTFADQGHSGMSAAIVMGLFMQLMSEYNDSNSIMWKKG